MECYGMCLEMTHNAGDNCVHLHDIAVCVCGRHPCLPQTPGDCSR